MGGLFGEVNENKTDNKLNYKQESYDQCWYLSGTNVPAQAAGSTTTALPNVGSKSSVSDFTNKTFIDNLNAAAQGTSGYRFNASTVTDLPTIEKAPAD